MIVSLEKALVALLPLGSTYTWTSCLSITNYWRQQLPLLPRFDHNHIEHLKLVLGLLSPSIFICVNTLLRSGHLLTGLTQNSSGFSAVLLPLILNWNPRDDPNHDHCNVYVHRVALSVISAFGFFFFFISLFLMDH